MNIEKISMEKLLPAKYNPRKDLQPGDPEFEKLKRSITEFGYVEPIIWNKRTGVVIGGHQRLKVLQHLGYTEVDCVVLDIDEQKEKALNVALNKISGRMENVPEKYKKEVSGANAFFIIPALTGKSLMEILSTHPSLERRVAALEKIESEMRGY